MITVEEYLAYCDKALDGYAAIARQLGDALVNERLADVPGSNTASGLIAHAAGVMARWGSTVNLGVVVPRDRDAEFLTTGTVADALALLEAARARLHADARSAAARLAPLNPPPPEQYPGSTRPRATCSSTCTRSSHSTSGSWRSPATSSSHVGFDCRCPAAG